MLGIGAAGIGTGIFSGRPRSRMKRDLKDDLIEEDLSSDDLFMID